MGLFDFLNTKKSKGTEIVNRLQSKITKDTDLEIIVNIFEEMCKEPIDDDAILFETGTFSFTGEPLFYFSLVRQFPNNEEEYFQIHVDVHYKPNEKNSTFKEATWNTEIEENIFDYIRKSETFAYAKSQKIFDVEIFIDET